MQKLKKYLPQSAAILLLAMFFSGFMQSAVAQNLPEVWDLKTCIAYAKQNNININTLRLNASSEKENVSLSKNARYPDLNGSVSASSSYSDNNLSNVTSYGINSSVVLFNGNYYNNDIKASELSYEAANLDVAAAENDITLEITQAYLNILLANENIEYVKDLVATSESQVKQYQEKYDAGSVALKDLLQLQATLANDKYSLVAAENTKRQNLLALKTILQLPAGTTLEIAIPDEVSTDILTASLDSVQRYALQTMPQIKSSELVVKKQNVELSKAKAGYWPSLSLNAGISNSYSSDAKYAYFHQLSDNYIPQAGLTLSIPIYNRKSNAIQVAKSKIQLEQAKLASDNEKTTLMQTVEQAYIDVQNAKSQLAAADEQLNFAKESFRISTEQLKLGANNNVEYLQQKNVYVQAMQQYVQAKYSLVLYGKIFNFYNGIPVAL